MKNSSVPIKETLYLALGEAAVSAIVIAIFAIIGRYDYTVLTGAVLGSAVIVINFLFLSVSVNRAIDRALENAPEISDTDSDEVITANEAEALTDGSEEYNGSSDSFDTEEHGHDDSAFDDDDCESEEADAATAFANQYAIQVQNAVKISYVIRVASMLAALVVAFVFGKVFNVIATVVPLLAFKPVLMLESLIRSKLASRKMKGSTSDEE